MVLAQWLGLLTSIYSHNTNSNKCIEVNNLRANTQVLYAIMFMKLQFMTYSFFFTHSFYKCIKNTQTHMHELMPWICG